MSNSAKSCMQFKGYEINSMHFELSKNDINNKEIKISPTFGMTVEDCGKDEYKVQLTFSLKASDENPLPFNIDVTMTGDFELCMEEENDILKEALLHENTVAIMFPFLRAVIASLTTTANINPLILPVINIANAFNNDK